MYWNCSFVYVTFYTSLSCHSIHHAHGVKIKITKLLHCGQVCSGGHIVTMTTNQMSLFL